MVLNEKRYFMEVDRLSNAGYDSTELVLLSAFEIYSQVVRNVTPKHRPRRSGINIRVEAG